MVIGSDSPTLPVTILRAAFGTLRLDADVVLGPAEDGGYYLVGASRPVAELFRGIPWGTPGVLEATVAAASRAAARLVLLPTWYDVDVPEDFDRLTKISEYLENEDFFSNSAKICESCSFSQECKTTLVTEVTPLAQTSPVAGRNKVISLAPPSRRYSWDCNLG